MLQKSMIIFLVIISMCHSTHQETVKTSTSSDATTLLYEEKLFQSVERISHHLEKFNLHYLTKLEDKFLSIMQTMNTIDMNVKLLQEKAQVWEIFRHHIESWTAHMKSVDQKIEILKSSQDRMPLMENQLQSMDFKVQHVFEKVDLLNEKFHDLSKNVLSENQKPSIGPKKSPKNFNFEAQEEFEQTEILMRLHSIQRMLTQVQRQNSPNFASKFNKNAEVMKSQRLTNLDQPADLNDVKNLLVKISTGIDKIPIRDIKQSFNLNRKQDKALETITELVNHIDERTTRIFDTNSYQFRKLLTCCKSTEHEITTFTSNADTLLKRVEKVMLKVDDNFELATGDKCPVTGNKTIEKERRSESDGEIHIYTDGESGSASGEDVENNLDEIDDQSVFQQPKKSHCYQLNTGRNGVYTFGYERELNAGGRDFLQQYCEFATDGAAWTVIQNRGDFDPQENFNRSWNEYKNGFGNLSRDFWFGNDYIHKLTYEDNMVLRIELEDFENHKMWVEYKVFRVESEKFKYNLIVDEYRGSIPDSFLYHNDMDFSTYDRNNDKVNTTCCPCALSLGSGWWFGNCAESNLNGVYKKNPKGNNFTGIFWEHWLADYSLKSTKMMIRPKDVWYTSGVSEEEFIELPKGATEEP